MDQAYNVFRHLVGERYDAAPNVTPAIMIVLAIAWIIHFTPDDMFQRLAKFFPRVPVPIRAAALVAVALIVKHVAAFDVQPFIYFQF
jgi:hypothetical protein